MDKCFFLIVTHTESEIFRDPYTKPFQSILQGLLNSQSNSVTYLIVPTYNILRKFRDEFPALNCILLDVDKDVETDKEIFKNLPEIDCILDFTGKLDSKILCWIPELEFKKKESWKLKNVNISKIDELINGSEEVLPALVTVLPKVQGTNPVTALTKVLRKKGAEAVKEAFSSRKTLQSIHFHPSRKYNSSADSDVPGPSSSISSALTKVERLLSRAEGRRGRSANATNPERESLLSPSSAQDSPSFLDTFSQFISWTWSNFCCCLFNCSPELSNLPEFRNDAHLQSYVRAEHYNCLRSKLTFEDADSILLRILRNIETDEVAEAETIRAEYAVKEQEIMDKFHEVVAKNKENQNSSTDKILIKAAASREQAELHKLKWVKSDLAKDLERVAIKYNTLKDTEGEERLYEELMTKQVGILRRAKSKYAQFANDLYEQHSSNWA